MNSSNRSMVRKIEKRLRRKYVRRCVLCFIIALIIGALVGVGLCKWGPLRDFVDPAKTGGFLNIFPAATEVPSAWAVTTVPPTDAPTEAPTEAPTTAPTAVPTEVPAAPTEAPTDAPAAPTEAPTQAPTEAPTEEPEAVEAASVETTDAPEAAAEAVQQATDAPDEIQIAAVTDAPEEPTAPLGSIENPIPMGQAYAFDTEIVQGGTPRYAQSMTDYSTVSLTADVLKYLTPEYFAENYSTKYKLQGNEAGAAVQFALSEGDVESINPQDTVLVCFESDNGRIVQGYQLMDAEIAGDYGVQLAAGEEKTYYKRFAYTTDPEMKYLTITRYKDGQADKLYFSLEQAETPVEEASTTETEAVTTETTPEPTAEPTPAPTYETIQNGSRGDSVRTLQQRLIELGFLNDVADGIAGGNTEAAIRAAQEKGGFTVDGVADSDFQAYIFSDEAHSAND